MEDTSPYQPPASAPPPMPTDGMREPSSLRVFGILHLILAGLGVIFGISSFFARQTNSLFIRSGDPASEAQLRYVEEVHWVSVMTGIFMLVLAGLLLVAGLKLVRSQPDGVAWSNRYAWTSIATKLVSLVVTVAVLLPAMRRMIGGLMPAPSGMPPGSAAAFSNIMQTVMAVSVVAGPIISCVYPGLALYFLSRPQVKDWANRREPRRSLP